MTIITGDTDTCIACFEDTTNHVECCNAPICEDCYYTWLKTKRQCMHCKEDQCDFDLWVNEYREEPDFDPQEYLHELIQQDAEQIPAFGIQNLLNAIQQTMIDPSVTIEAPDQLPPADTPFEFQFGFTMTPTDLQGNPIGPEITVAENIEYPGINSNELYNQIQEGMIQYQQLFNQQENQLPNCTQQ